MAVTSTRHILGSVLVVSALAVGGCGGASPPAGPSLRLPNPTVRAVTPTPLAIGAPVTSVTPNAVPQLPAPVPGALGYGPPPWVQPGMRLSYYGAAASIAQDYYTYVEDENGDWQDPKTGKRYRRTDHGSNGDPGQDMPTAAGEAYTQTDVLAIEGTDVVVSNSLYSIDLLSRQLALTPLGGSRTTGAAIDGGWVNPDLLRGLQTSGYGDQMILRGSYSLNGVTYDAVSFVGTASGAYQDSTYDLATGVLLATNTSTRGQDSPLHGPLDNPQGNVQLSLTRFVGVRQRSMPGMGAALPGWVTAMPTLTYSGTYTIVNALDPMNGRFTYPMELSISFGSGGRTWAPFTSQTVIQVAGFQPTQATGVSGPTGLYWYDPTALATLTPGQVIDDDAVTGARTSVESVSPGASGGVVGVVTAMNGVTVRAGYDRAGGCLVSLQVVQAVTYSTIDLQLTAGPG